MPNDSGVGETKKQFKSNESEEREMDHDGEWVTAYRKGRVQKGKEKPTNRKRVQ